MYEYVAMHKPVVIAETPAVRTHFDDSCFQFFTSDDPADLARALRELYYNPARAADMIEAASRRYRGYAWEAQRHIYRDAALGTATRHAPATAAVHEKPRVPATVTEPIPHVPAVPQLAPVLVVSNEPMAHVTSHVPSVVEASLARSSMDLSGMGAPIEDASK
jgi:hypothetical protein